LALAAGWTVGVGWGSDRCFAREAGYFDDVTTVIQGGSSSVKALTGSTEEEQFH
jgi:hypothetical protein